MSQSRPLGRSIASTGARGALTASTIVCEGGRAAASTRPVPKMASMIRIAECRRSARRRRQARVRGSSPGRCSSWSGHRPCIARGRSCRAMRDICAAVVEMAGDGQAVAAVVAAAAEDEDLRRRIAVEHIARDVCRGAARRFPSARCRGCDIARSTRRSIWRTWAAGEPKHGDFPLARLLIILPRRC